MWSSFSKEKSWCDFVQFNLVCSGIFPNIVKIIFLGMYFFFHVPSFFLQVVPCLQFLLLCAVLLPFIYQLHLLCSCHQLSTHWTEAQISEKALSTGIQLGFPIKKKKIYILFSLSKSFIPQLVHKLKFENNWSWNVWPNIQPAERKAGELPPSTRIVCVNPSGSIRRLIQCVRGGGWRRLAHPPKQKHRVLCCVWGPFPGRERSVTMLNQTREENTKVSLSSFQDTVAFILSWCAEHFSWPPNEAAKHPPS